MHSYTFRPAYVRHAFRQTASHARRSPGPRTPVRGGRRQGRARDSPRPARGRRQPEGRQGVRRAREGAGPRRGRDEERHARPAGREDRPRGADRAHGHRRLEARVRRAAADRDPARGPPGLRQDDLRREARAAPAQAGEDACARCRRSPAPGRDRPARAARQADPDSGVRETRHDRRGRGREGRPRAGEGAGPRRRDRRHRGPSPRGRRADGRARARAQGDQSDERAPRARLDDRPGRGRRRGGVRRARRSSTGSC